MQLTNQSSSEPSVRPAATMVLLRDGARGPEVLLTVRPEHLRFMGGAVVFPGGAVAKADVDPRWAEASTLGPEEAAAALGLTNGAQALGYYVCALREAFEEVGYLGADGPVPELGPAEAAAPGAFLERCLSAGTRLDTAALRPAGRWVTPLGSPVRFDTRFFVARAPADFVPTPDPTEVADCRWATPGEALADLAGGRSIMAPPTIEMLQRLNERADVEETLAAIADSGPPPEGGVLRARLSPLVVGVLAPNPGLMTGPGTNTYVAGAGRVAVIDVAVEDQAYLDAIEAAAPQIEVVLVTHRHPDHVGGVAALAQRSGAAVRAFGDEPAGGAAVEPLGDGEVVEVGGLALRALHTPGHAPDHLCFFAAETASLFSGDNVLGEGTAVIAPPDGDMSDYLASLRRLGSLHIERIYPGHFRPLDGGNAVIDHYLEHRAERERAILDAIEGPSIVEQIVERVYADTPPQLHPVAAYQVRAHLELLERAGLVKREGGAGSQNSEDIWLRAER